MDLGLKDKVAIVTGGASNIGRAISITLAAERAIVAIADIDPVQSGKVVKIISEAGGKAIAIKTDVTNYKQVEAMVAEIINKLQKVDILVNCLGYDKTAYFVETTPDLWDELININYRAALNCCRTVLPYMIKQQSGSLITIASEAARVGGAREAVYAGCKAGQIALTKTIALENSRFGIRANAICPGMTPGATEEVGDFSIHKGRVHDPERIKKILTKYPLGRLGKPQDVANAVAFLASDVACFITGQTLSVSGGFSMV